MLRDILASLDARGRSGAVEVILERTRLVSVPQGKRKDVETIPLDMVGAVTYGRAPRTPAFALVGAAALLVLGAAAGWMWLNAWNVLYYGAAGFFAVVLFAFGVLMTLQSGGERIVVRGSDVEWTLWLPDDRADEATDFAEKLLLARLAFLEGVYGEEDEA